jgi:hypothetical protein
MGRGPESDDFCEICSGLRGQAGGPRDRCHRIPHNLLCRLHPSPPRTAAMSSFTYSGCRPRRLPPVKNNNLGIPGFEHFSGEPIAFFAMFRPNLRFRRDFLMRVRFGAGLGPRRRQKNKNVQVAPIPSGSPCTGCTHWRPKRTFWGGKRPQCHESAAGTTSTQNLKRELSLQAALVLSCRRNKTLAPTHSDTPSKERRRAFSGRHPPQKKRIAPTSNAPGLSPCVD